MVTYLPGERTDSRTHAMLREAEKRSKCPIVVVQGSWSDGENSAGTHSGAGAVDVRTWNQSSPAAVDHLELWLRRVGFAGWFRSEVQGPWGDHIHAVAIGEEGLSWSAAAQVQDYYAGRDGLARNGPDTGPRLDPIPTWETYSDGSTLPDTGGDMVKFIGNSKLARWFETRVANGVMNAVTKSTQTRQGLRDVVSSIEVENRVDGKSYPWPVAASSTWWYGFLAGVEAVNGEVPDRFRDAAAELNEEAR